MYELYELDRSATTAPESWSNSWSLLMQPITQVAGDPCMTLAEESIVPLIVVERSKS
jgi:hypothetical protein